MQACFVLTILYALVGRHAPSFGVVRLLADIRRLYKFTL